MSNTAAASISIPAVPSSVGIQKKSEFRFLPHGATIQSFIVAGQNIVQNFPEPELYELTDHPYLGRTIGRTSNRIKNARLENLNGKTYELYANNGPNSLHGGKVGWDKKIWDGPTPVNRNGKEGVLFQCTSPDSEEGFPGTVGAKVWYLTSTEDDKIILEVEYEAELVGDECEETVVAMTNHSYFNLNLPAPTISGTLMTVGTTLYQEITPDGIPTGAISPYPFIPSQPHIQFEVTDTTPDLDDCFVMNPDPSSIPLDTRSLPLKTLCTLYHPDTGIHLEIVSTEPAFQAYTSRFMDIPEVEASTGEKVPARGKRCAIAIEPSRYVNAAGEENWRGMCLLKKGQLFGSRSIYRAWKE